MARWRLVLVKPLVWVGSSLVILLASGRGDDASGAVGGGQGVDSYKRAAEVTSQLKARIEQIEVMCSRLSWEFKTNP